MKLTRLQFGVRENTASSRQHASRLEMPSLSSPSDDSSEGSHYREQARALTPRVSEHRDSLPDKPLTAATVGEQCDHTDALAVPGRVTTANGFRHAFEPLIGCDQAAELLGKIHVKTLQRYARRGNLPSQTPPAERVAW
jgi:hypothetical protein